MSIVRELAWLSTEREGFLSLAAEQFTKPVWVLEGLGSVGCWFLEDLCELGQPLAFLSPNDQMASEGPQL